MHRDVVLIVASLIITGLVASIIFGSVLTILPCALAAWAVWCVAAGLDE
jgi:hypothetical protein